MRKLCLLVIVQCIILSVCAQTKPVNQNIEPAEMKSREPANPFKDKLVYQGYTIRIIPSEQGGYGYTIFQGKKLAVHQSYNPFTMSPSGLQTKEDAYKVAKWEVDQLKEAKKQEGKPQQHQSKLEPSKPIQPEVTAAKGTDLPPSLLARLSKTERKINQPISRKVAEALQIKIN